MRRHFALLVRALVLLLAAALASCGPAPPPPEAPKVSAPMPAQVLPAPSVTAPAGTAPPGTAPVTAPSVTAPIAPAPATSNAPGPAIAMPSSDPPPGPLYVCDEASARTPLEYDTRVDQLCRRHPQMGPCRYERDACRARGGRVFTARGEEITAAVEAEYDRVVRRTRFQADGGRPAR